MADTEFPTAKFAHPDLTAKGETRASVGWTGLKTLWFNTGTLCNIECTNCYILSSPRNDRLVYLRLADVQPYLDEIDGPVEIGITGGEPFMCPEILPIMEEILGRGHSLLLLTNAMRPMMRPRVQEGLKRILADGNRDPGVGNGDPAAGGRSARGGFRRPVRPGRGDKS